MATVISTETVRVDRKRVTWTWTDSLSKVFGPYVSHIPNADNAQSYADAQETANLAALLAAEIENNLEGIIANISPAFRYSTAAQLRTRARQEFQVTTSVRLHRLARWIDINLTDAQLKNIFNLSDAQTTALRSRLQTMHARIDAVDSEVGQ